MPESAVAAVRERARVDGVVERAQEIERRTHHDVIAFTEAVAEQVGRRGALVPLRADVVRRRRHGARAAAARGGRRGARRAATARSTPCSSARCEHRDTPCMGRTHGVHAEPTTFGLKLLGWWYELRRGRERRRARLRRRRRRQALGRRRRVRQRRPARRGARAGARSASGVEDVATQVVARDRHAELLASLGDARQLARPLRDRDPPPAAQRGARGRGAVRARPEGLLGDAAQAQPDHLRAHLRPRARAARQRRRRASRTWRSGTSATSRTPRPSASCCADSTTLAHYLLDRFAWVVEGLEVYPERMRRNIDAAHGLTFSGGVLLALVEAGLCARGGLRDRAAQRAARVRRGAAAARAARGRPRGRGAARCRYARRIFDLDAALRNAGVAFDRLEAAHV